MRNKKERDYFLDACFSDNLQEWYSNYIQEKPSRVQQFIKVNGRWEHRYWIPSNICRATKKKLDKSDAVVAHGYWTPNCWFPIHKDLKREYELSEAYECQKIDAACNDCGFFDRANSWCNKLNKPTHPAPNFCQNNSCFVHRKDVTHKLH